MMDIVGNLYEMEGYSKVRARQWADQGRDNMLHAGHR